MKLIIMMIMLVNIVFADKDGGYLNQYHGITKKGVAPVNNQLYIKECAACHFAYQPGLLPSSSWDKMMKNLSNHYGTDASLTPSDYKLISNYLNTNSAEKNMQYKRSNRIASSLNGKVVNSLSEVPYIIEKHREIKKSLITQQAVKGLYNCKACHTNAETGSYDDNNIKIPNYGKWNED